MSTYKVSNREAFCTWCWLLRPRKSTESSLKEAMTNWAAFRHFCSHVKQLSSSSWSTGLIFDSASCSRPARLASSIDTYFTEMKDGDHQGAHRRDPRNNSAGLCDSLRAVVTWAGSLHPQHLRESTEGRSKRPRIEELGVRPSITRPSCRDHPQSSPKKQHMAIFDKHRAHP